MNNIFVLVGCFVVVAIVGCFLSYRFYKKSLVVFSKHLQDIENICRKACIALETSIPDNSKDSSNRGAVGDRISMMQLSAQLYHGYNYEDLYQGQAIFERQFLIASLYANTLLSEAKETKAIVDFAGSPFLKKFMDGKVVTTLGVLQPNFPEDVFSSVASISHIKSLLPSESNLAAASSKASVVPLLEIPQTLAKTHVVLITNPYIASILLLYPTLIGLLSQKIKGELIFPCLSGAEKFSITWDHTFSAYESDGEHHWRWALACAEANSVLLTNNTFNVQTINFKFTVWLTKPERLAFKCYFLNSSFQYSVSHNTSLEFTLNVPPGRHRLLFVCASTIVKAPDDARNLNFAIADLIATSEEATVRLAGKSAYSNAPDNDLSPFGDETIRHTLHRNGFFEVQAITSSADSRNCRELAVTRFHIINGFYEHKPAVKLGVAEENIVPNRVWYIAKRTATLVEE